MTNCYIEPSLHLPPSPAPPAPGTLPYLFQSLFVLDEGLASLILKLIYSAISGTPPAKEEGSSVEAEPGTRSHASRSSRRKELLEEQRKAKEKSKEKEAKVVVAGKWVVWKLWSFHLPPLYPPIYFLPSPSLPSSLLSLPPFSPSLPSLSPLPFSPSLSPLPPFSLPSLPPAPNKEQCKALVQMFLSLVDTRSLSTFADLFLLQSNSSPLRWQAHQLLHCLYQYSSPSEQLSLVEILWELWPSMPSNGHKATQFVDLLGYLTISTPPVLQKVYIGGRVLT